MAPKWTNRNIGFLVQATAKTAERIFTPNTPKDPVWCKEVPLLGGQNANFNIYPLFCPKNLIISVPKSLNLEKFAYKNRFNIRALTGVEPLSDKIRQFWLHFW
jgi:hypothetical protein